MASRDFESFCDRNVDHTPSGLLFDDVKLVKFESGRAMIKIGHRKYKNWQFFSNHSDAEDHFYQIVKESWQG